MRRVIRRALGVGGALLALATAFAAGAVAAPPEGPRLGFVKWGPRAYAVSVITTNPAGTQPKPLIRAVRRTRPFPSPVEGPAWFPDGSAIAFTGLTGSLQQEHGVSGMSVFIVDVMGGVPHPVAGTESGQAPVISPDGRTLAFVRTRELTRIERRPGEYVERVDEPLVPGLSTSKAVCSDV